MGKIIMKQVKSSNIKAVGYDPDTKELYIKFSKTGIYKYRNVESEKYEEFINSDSLGSYFFRKIKNKHLCLKV